MDESSLSHTRWDCKYHIVFAPKFRRKEIFGTLKSDIGKIMRELCEHKGVEIMEANACVDHIHMLVRIPPKVSVSSFMGYLKGKSSLMIFDRLSRIRDNLSYPESFVIPKNAFYYNIFKLLYLHTSG